MGCRSNIGHDKFPKQSKWHRQRADVLFHYDTSKKFGGWILRDDEEEPFETIIALDDGRVVRGCECQYAPKKESP